MTPKRSGPGALAGATEAGKGCAERQAASDSTAPPATTRQQPRLNRETFRASRLLEFCSERNPVAQTGHSNAVVDLVCQHHPGAVEEGGQ
jgi:hypothetical protein